MSYDDIMKDFQNLIERSIKKDQVNRIMLLHAQDFPVESIASVYEMTSEDVEKVIKDNKAGYDWGNKFD